MTDLAKPDANESVDNLHRALRQLPAVEMPVTHLFTPGLYLREIFMPAGTMVISKIHKTEHPYVISKGRARVWTENEGVKEFCAPHCGVTKPGTRRVLLILEDCIWTTCHATSETDVDKIEAKIIEPREVGDGPAIDIDIMKQLTQEVTCHGQL
jgi:hypothetical protein